MTTASQARRIETEINGNDYVLRWARGIVDRSPNRTAERIGYCIVMGTLDDGLEPPSEEVMEMVGQYFIDEAN